MSLQSIYINNFKSLNNTTFEFSETGLTVLVGANGSGKTNLVSVFDFLKKIYDKSTQNKSGLSEINPIYDVLPNVSKFNTNSNIQIRILDSLKKQHIMEFKTTGLEKLEIQKEEFDLGFSFNQKIGVFQFIPKVRYSKEPTFNPPVILSNISLEKTGRGLVERCDWLIREYPDQWNSIMEILLLIFPNLEKVEVQLNPFQKFYELLFIEESGIKWTIQEVSDGTFIALCMAVAIVDPTIKIAIIEEPENFFHRWLLRSIIELMRNEIKLSNKQFVITTHSHVLVDMLFPTEVRIVYKKENFTQLKSLLSIKPEIIENWKEGKGLLSTYLDSSLLPAVPNGNYEL